MVGNSPGGELSGYGDWYMHGSGQYTGKYLSPACLFLCLYSRSQSPGYSLMSSSAISPSFPEPTMAWKMSCRKILHETVSALQTLYRYWPGRSRNIMFRWTAKSYIFPKCTALRENITVLAPPTRDISSVPIVIFYIRWSKWMIIDRDGQEISCFGGLPRELYFPQGIIFSQIAQHWGKILSRGKNITVLAPPTRNISSVPVDIFYIRWSKWMISSKFYVLNYNHEVW